MWIMRRSPPKPEPAVSRVTAAAMMLALVLSTTAIACTGKDPFNPGTKLGTFHVTAKLTATTCGPVPNPWQFDVRLNHDGSTLYWVQGGAPVQAQVDASARAQLKSESVHDLRAADPKTKEAACTAMRSDVLTITLAAADSKPNADPAQTASFSGTLLYTFAPTESSDCADQLTAAGGGFEALPCEVRYEVAGAFKSPPP